MNIVYKFTSKVTHKFYIGSKSECTVIDGFIYSLKDGTKYYSSSSSEDFWLEVFQGNMVLSVLEIVNDRSILLEREAFYQLQENAKYNPMCFNKVLATDIRNVITKKQWQSLVNMYKETLIIKSKNNSKIARLNAAAVREGFKNYGDKAFKYASAYKDLKIYKKVDNLFGKDKYSRRFLKGISIEDFYEDVSLATIQEYLSNGASFIKACELSYAKPHNVIYKFGYDLSTRIDVRNKIAIANNFTNRSDFGKEILKLYLEGKSFKSICKIFTNVSHMSVARILQDEIIKRLDINAV